MDHASMFRDTMSALWDDDEAPIICHAIASFVKTHARANHENAFDVLRIVWPDAAHVDIREPDHEYAKVGDSLHTIKFADGSSVIVCAANGIGNSVEML